MKRYLYILLLTTLYIFTLSAALEFLPLYDSPDGFAALFAKKYQGQLAWMKIREVAVVGFIAYLVAMLLVYKNKEKPKNDAIIVGVLALLWGPALRLAVLGGEGWSWLEVSDYLVTALAVPVFVAFLCKGGRGGRYNIGAASR